MMVDAPITGPLALTLLWRERPRRQYGNRPSGKLCPLKRARRRWWGWWWGSGGWDVTLKTYNPTKYIKNKNESIMAGQPTAAPGPCRGCQGPRGDGLIIIRVGRCSCG